MATYKQGNMWDRLKVPCNEAFLVTTNNIIKTSGALVMGAGVAKQAALRFNGIEFLFGKKIKTLPPDYYFFMLEEQKEWNNLYNQHVLVGALQTKRHYKNNSDVDLVRKSVEKLNEYASKHNIIINSAMPGVGNGKLSIDRVKKITDTSPDNVVYWTY